MKRFFVRLTIFLSPIFAIALLIIASAIYLADIIPIPYMIRWQVQSSEPIVYQPWDQNNLFDYKFEAIRQQEPDLLILGSSRMTRFRAALANQNPGAFYNAAIPSSNIFHHAIFLREIVAAGLAPDVIVLGLDITNYNAAYNAGNRRLHPSPITLKSNLLYSYASIQRVSRFWLEDSAAMFGYLSSSRQDGLVFAGLQVLTTQRGFLADGSRYVDNLEELLPDILDEQEEGLIQQEGQFLAGTDVNESALAAVERILIQARDNDIALISILPPFRPSFYDVMMASDDYAYIDASVQALEALFAEYEQPLYNFSDPGIVGGHEDEMTDSWHFSDLMSLRIYAYLLQQDPDLLGQFSDAETLSAWIEEYQADSRGFFLIELP